MQKRGPGTNCRPTSWEFFYKESLVQINSALPVQIEYNRIRKEVHNMRNTCSLCPASAHGTVNGEKYCQKHYRRIQRNGDPTIVKRAGRPRKIRS